MINIRAPIWSYISGHSGASGGRFRLDFGTMWGAISGSRARDAKLAKIAPHHSESMIFGVPRGPKKDQKWLRNQLPVATWLQERLGGLWGSILVHFGIPQITQKSASEPRARPGLAQGSPRGLQRAFREAFWAHFGFNSVPPRAHVRAFSGCTFASFGLLLVYCWCSFSLASSPPLLAF